MDYEQIKHYIWEEYPSLAVTEVDSLIDHLYSSEYVRHNPGDWQQVIDIILSRPDVYPLTSEDAR
jgi:hypothetical protein